MFSYIDTSYKLCGEYIYIWFTFSIEFILLLRINILFLQGAKVVIVQKMYSNKISPFIYKNKFSMDWKFGAHTFHRKSLGELQERNNSHQIVSWLNPNIPSPRIFPLAQKFLMAILPWIYEP